MANQISSNHKFTFQAAKLRSNFLPTYKNVIEAIYFEKGPIKKAVKIVAEDIVSIWKKILLPTVTVKAVTDKLKRYHDEYLKIVHADASRLNYQDKVQQFKVRKKKCSMFVSYTTHNRISGISGHFIRYIRL